MSTETPITQKPTKHHRKPKAHGGSGKKNSGNISLVPYKDHMAYHAVFGIRSPLEVVYELNIKWKNDDTWAYVALTKKTYWRKKRRKQNMRKQIERAHSVKTKRAFRQLRKHITHKKQLSFNFLFAGKTPSEIAKILTETWIDPHWIIIAVPAKKS